MRRLGHLWVPGADGIPNIITRRTIEIPLRTCISLSGRFKWELGRNLDRTAPGYRSDKEVIFAGGYWQDNLILNSGLDAFGAGSVLNNLVFNQYMAVGTGGAAPLVTDTTLVSELGRTNSSGGFGLTADFLNNLPTELFGSKSVTRLFLEGEVNGNLTEFGMVDQAAGGTFWNRALFLDAPGGSPTTVVKTVADQLRITYELRNYPPLGSLLENAVTIGVTLTNIETKAGNANASATRNWFGSAADVSFAFFNTMGQNPGVNAMQLGEDNTVHTNITDSASFFGDTPTTMNTAAYVTGTFFREQEGIWEPPEAVFATGIGKVGHNIGNSGQNFISYFSTKIPKLNTERLTLLWRHEWARNTGLTNPATP